MDQREKYPLALPQGTILAGQYIIEQVLGQGGFGITYRATDHKSGQAVAVKEFFPDTLVTRTQTTVTALSDERSENFSYGKACFLQEAETLAEFIGNENIVRVHSYFEENGTAYFVMDYVEGVSFDRYIKEHGGRVSYEETEKILIPIMDALAAVHSRGIVHRDVTPDNIFITSDGTVKLLDFGAARYSLGDKSRSLDVVLKHGFAPKEQYTRHGRQGAFTDVYTLAATFYFAITGRRPPDSIDRLEEDNLFPPSSLGVEIPEHKEDAILKGLSNSASDRFQTMVDFKRALLADGAVTAPSVQEENSEFPPEAKTETEVPLVREKHTITPLLLWKKLSTGMKAGIAAAACLVVVLLIVVVATLPRGKDTPVIGNTDTPQPTQIASAPTNAPQPFPANTQPKPNTQEVQDPESEDTTLPSEIFPEDTEPSAGSDSSETPATQTLPSSEEHSSQEPSAPKAPTKPESNPKTPAKPETKPETPAKPTTISLGGKTFSSDVETLDLSYCEITDLSKLKKLTNIKELSLNGNKELTDLSPLSSLVTLQRLTLYRCDSVSDITPLSKLTKLKHLDISFTKVENISALRELTKLQYLHMDGTGIRDISVLEKLTDLNDLYLSSTYVKDISVLKKLTKLEKLNLNSTKITSISALRELTKLTELYLYQTNISDISALRKLTKLQRLRLDYTNISDISVLFAMTDLNALWIDNTNVSYSDITALRSALPNCRF